MEVAKILIAEDDPVNQRIIKLQVEKMGCAVDLAADGYEALELLSKQPYALILMDCRMPKMDGFMATVEIRKREGVNHHTPIIAITGYAHPEEKSEALQVGMDDHLIKPVKSGALHEVLLKHLQDTSFASNPMLEPLDIASLKSLTNNDKQALCEIVMHYLSHLKEARSNLLSAIKAKNGTDIERITHKCIGSSGSIGCYNLSNLFHEIQLLGRQERLQDLSPLLEDLDKEINIVENYCKAKLS